MEFRGPPVEEKSAHLLLLLVLLIAVVVCSQGSVLAALLREVKGGAVALRQVEHGHLQVLLLVQRLLPAAGVGARVRVGQERLHLPRLAPPVEAGGSARAGPAGSAALWPAVPQRLEKGRMRTLIKQVNK